MSNKTMMSKNVIVGITVAVVVIVILLVTFFLLMNNVGPSKSSSSVATTTQMKSQSDVSYKDNSSVASAPDNSSDIQNIDNMISGIDSSAQNIDNGINSQQPDFSNY